MIHEKHQAWLDQRGSLSGAAEAMGVSTVQRHGKNWLCIPYRLRGEIVNRKYRLTSEKRHEMDKGGKLCLWNAEALSGGPSEVIITEGEFDALAAMRCGFSNVVSVPNGAPSDEIEDPLSANSLGFMWEHKSELEAVKSFVLATDGDTRGRGLGRALATILGQERCKFLDYPEGCKDLNEVLVQKGPEAVTNLVSEAKPIPVKGLYRLSDFPPQQEVQSMRTGIPQLDDLMRIVLGTLTVFTGYSNMGKSTVLNTILAWCITRNVRICVASFETLPRPILENALESAIRGNNDHSPKEAAEMLNSHLHIISNALDDDMEMDLDYYLETLRVAVVRDGVKVVVLDPWNELEHKRRRDETETDYIGRAIRHLKAFAKRYNVALWVVAHPTKPQKGFLGEPSLYDISGSANWANKADYGLVYHRPDRTQNAGTVSVVKVRMGLPGKCGKIAVRLNNQSGRIEHDPMSQL